jgi:hypothetical protein
MQYILDLCQHRLRTADHAKTSVATQDRAYKPTARVKTNIKIVKIFHTISHLLLLKSECALSTNTT